MVSQKLVIHWFRRDLRLDDNKSLFSALTSGFKVIPLFIFDTEILDELPDDDRRVSLIYNRLIELSEQLGKYNSSIFIEYGKPYEVFERLLKTYSIDAVYTNEDYEPYAIARDRKIEALLKRNGVKFQSFTDQVLVHPSLVKKKDGKPYTVFTPWSKQWLQKFDPSSLENYPSEQHLKNILPEHFDLPDLKELGFTFQKVDVNTSFPSTKILSAYAEQRNFPAQNGTSRLSVALRFGIISIRKLAAQSSKSKVYLNELGWREFYMMILYFFPKVVTESFKSKYDNIQWRNNKKEFELWKLGKTGYPIVDAGMRQLLESGYMHNRLRMITASFLTKHLLIDWRWGESWFAEKLLDYELASNNGGWQWAAGTGCDAAPYFRVFNPTTQTEKFDPELSFIRRWVPEFETFNYTQPIVEHKFARQRALDIYKKALN